jgi:integrase
MQEPHIVPLSTKAVKILEELRPITYRDKYVFSSARGPSRPLSDNGVRTALMTLGYSNNQISPNEFRAMAHDARRDT